MNRRKRIVRDGSSPLRRSAAMSKITTSTSLAEGPPCWQCNQPINDLSHQCPVTSPLSTPRHREFLRNAARAAIKATVESWLRMGADPEDIAFALEGSRVEVMAIGRARGKQG